MAQKEIMCILIMERGMIQERDENWGEGDT